MNLVPFLWFLFFALLTVNASVFKNKDWDNGKVELLYYDAEIAEHGTLIRTEILSFTRALYLNKHTGSVTKVKRKKTIPIIKHDFQYKYNINEQVKSGFITAKFHRTSGIMLEQEVFWNDWHDYVHRRWKANKNGYKIESNSNREGKRVYSITSEKVLSSEELFSWVRNLDLTRSNTTEIMLMEPMTRYTVNPKVFLAVVEVHSTPVEILDQNSVYVQILKESGETYQFWVSPQGNKRVLKAVYPDGTVYKLRGSKWITPSIL